MNAWTWRTWGLVVALLAGLLPAPASAAPADCAIAEGAGIGAVRIGMDERAALAATGPPVRQEASGSQITYTLRAPWSQMIADYGIVRRISTRAAKCRTRGGIGPGSPLPAVRDAYAAAGVSSTTRVQDATLLSYPFVGVAFLVRGDRVEIVDVFRAEGGAGTRPAAPAAVPAPAGPTPPGAKAAAGPSPTPTTAAGTWRVKTAAVRVEDADLVVYGAVENRSRTQSAYAEVRVFDAAGRRVGDGNAPLQPSPVPGGGSASFEVRVTVTDVVRKYTVTIRPAGGSGSLADYTGEVKDARIFGPIVARQLQVQVQVQSPNRNGFVVIVTNGSSLPVASASVTVELNVTCRFTIGSRFTQEVWTGSVLVQGLPPGGTAQSPLTLTGGICEGTVVAWTAAHRVGDVRIADQ